LGEAAALNFGGQSKRTCVVAARSTVAIRAALSTLDSFLIELLRLLHVQHYWGLVSSLICDRLHGGRRDEKNHWPSWRQAGFKIMPDFSLIWALEILNTYM
jgi:hypothetical protein